MIIPPSDKHADLDAIARKCGEKRLSLAGTKELKEKMGVEPGSVSPFNLIHTQDAFVEICIDKTVHEADAVGFHPNRNTTTIELSKEMFRKLLKVMRVKVEVYDL